VRIGPELQSVGEMRKLNKNKNKKGRTKVTKPLNIITVWRRPREPISTKVGVFVGLTNVITYANNGCKIVNGFSKPTGGKTHASLQ
jgi:hypothetical protein